MRPCYRSVKALLLATSVEMVSVAGVALHGALARECAAMVVTTGMCRVT